MFGCAMIFTEHASVKFAPAVLEPEGVILTAPMSTDYKEKTNSKNRINSVIVYSHMFTIIPRGFQDGQQQ